MKLTVALLFHRAHDRLVATIAAQHRARARLIRREIAFASLSAQRAEPQILLAERRRLLNVDQIGAVERLGGILARLQRFETTIESHLRGAGEFRSQLRANQPEIRQRPPADAQRTRAAHTVTFAR